MEKICDCLTSSVRGLLSNDSTADGTTVMISDDSKASSAPESVQNTQASARGHSGTIVLMRGNSEKPSRFSDLMKFFGVKSNNQNMEKVEHKPGCNADAKKTANGVNGPAQESKWIDNNERRMID